MCPKRSFSALKSRLPLKQIGNHPEMQMRSLSGHFTTIIMVACCEFSRRANAIGDVVMAGKFNYEAP